MKHTEKQYERLDGGRRKMTTQEQQNMYYFLDAYKKDIEQSIEDGLLNVALEDSIRLIGISAFLWQCDMITYDEWVMYREFAWAKRNRAERELAMI